MNKPHLLSALTAARIYLAFIVAIGILFSITYGQTPADELQRKRKEFAEAMKKAEEEFYKQPPIIRVSFFINDIEVPLKEGAHVSMLSDGNEIKPLSTEGDKFLFPAMKEDFGVELMTTELKEKGYPLRFNYMKPWYVEHGAEMIFGIITDLKLLKTQPRFDGPPYDETYTKRSAYCDSRNRFLSRLKINKKETAGVAFLILLPRVYGDGTVQLSTYGIPKTKNKK